jgi:Holliday junction resolvasome RuvABC endonuclease subunit
MKVLALDLSSSTGWALVDTDETTVLDGVTLPKLLDCGVLQTDLRVKDYGNYPFSLLNAAKAFSDMCLKKVEETDPDVIIIEELVLGRNRMSQKFLGYLHCLVLQGLPNKYLDKVFYVNPSEWRKALKIGLTKEDKKLNTKLSQAKSLAKKRKVKLDRKALGIRGRFGKKHASIRWVNAAYNKELKVKDDDIADAICQAASYCNGIKYCDGK